VIYDRRLLNKAYGSRLLAALPVFPIEQPPMPEASSDKTKKRRSKKI
jgi:ATP-dependent DNA helicase DinG